jgi:hypothetical protein
MPKVNCYLGVIEDQGEGHAGIWLVGEPGSITQIHNLWMSEWEKFWARGLRLTMKDCALLEYKKPKLDPRLNGTTFIDQHRGIHKTPFSTWCDFGQSRRKTQMGYHLKRITAQRQFLRGWDNYGRRGEWNYWLQTTVFSKTASEPSDLLLQYLEEMPQGTRPSLPRLRIEKEEPCLHEQECELTT